MLPTEHTAHQAEHTALQAEHTALQVEHRPPDRTHTALRAEPRPPGGTHSPPGRTRRPPGKNTRPSRPNTPPSRLNTRPPGPNTTVIIYSGRARRSPRTYITSAGTPARSPDRTTRRPEVTTVNAALGHSRPASAMRLPGKPSCGARRRRLLTITHRTITRSRAYTHTIHSHPPTVILTRPAATPVLSGSSPHTESLDPYGPLCWGCAPGFITLRSNITRPLAGRAGRQRPLAQVANVPIWSGSE